MVNRYSQIKSYPTPVISDVLFYETGIDLSLDRYADIRYGTPHPDKEQWPHHFVVDIQPDPQRGDESYVVFYAAKRQDQEKYAWEHSKANLGGNKYDSVTRSYVELRQEFNPDSPALGSTMPDVPSGKFDASEFILVARDQYRVSERAKRGQSTIGSAELDAMFVVIVQTYVRRSTVVAEKYDASTNGPLYTRQTFWVRGEVYDATTSPPTTIEQAVETASYWVPSNDGQVSEFSQVSTDVWIVTTQDLIPQGGLPSGTALFGGTFLREYETTVTHTWPSVLASDVTNPDDAEDEVTNAFDLRQWATTAGGYRTYISPVYKRNGFRGPSKAVIHEEWLSESQLNAAESAGSLDIIRRMEPEPIYYAAPQLSINVPACLHAACFLVADIGSGDPFWAANTGSRRDFSATNYTDWPAAGLVIDLNVSPSRGGYLLRKVIAYPPFDNEPAS